jgi:S-adenosylmethionine-dependent methyltransferase
MRRSIGAFDRPARGEQPVAQRSLAGSTPRTAVLWEVLRDELDRRHAETPLRVLDVGGGTGGFAVPFAEAGHEVTVVDSSPDALAALLRRAAESGVEARVHALQGDADSLLDVVATGSVDLALCHSVLEHVDDPEAAVTSLAGVLRTGGSASVLVANRAAAVFARALGGHFAQASAALTGPDGRWGDADSAQRRFDLESVDRLLRRAGLEVEQIHGVRIFADLLPGAAAEAELDAGDRLAALEIAAAELSPYRDVATQLHFLARKA